MKSDRNVDGVLNTYSKHTRDLLKQFARTLFGAFLVGDVDVSSGPDRTIQTAKNIIFLNCHPMVLDKACKFAVIKRPFV